MKVFWTLLSLTPPIVVGLIHNPLHGLVERVFAPVWHGARARLQELAERLVDDDSVTFEDADRALVEDTIDALSLECGALFQRQENGTFTVRRHVNWPASAKWTLDGDDAWVRSAGTEPFVPEEAASQPGESFIVVPIVRRTVRYLPARMVVYGKHRTGEVIDPDEMKILRVLSHAAAAAYLRLELESAAAARGGSGALPEGGDAPA